MIFFSKCFEEQGIGEASDIEPADMLVVGEIWEVIGTENFAFGEEIFGVFDETDFGSGGGRGSDESVESRGGGAWGGVVLVRHPRRVAEGWFGGRLEWAAASEESREERGEEEKGGGGFGDRGWGERGGEGWGERGERDRGASADGEGGEGLAEGAHFQGGGAGDGNGGWGEEGAGEVGGTVGDLEGGIVLGAGEVEGPWA